MIKINSKEYRNLQEQVYKNMSDIATIKAGKYVLDEFGIKVIGQVDSVANMPSVADYKANNPDWEYGDAYAVGEDSPYTLYILTRADDDGHPNDYWFNIGEFPAVGPEGPEGPQGETGPQGPQGNPGVNGTSAGFASPRAAAITLPAGSDAQVSVVASGPDSSKEFAFTFGIPQGQPGQDGASQWGDITGNIVDQTDLVSALQGKQNTLVSGTNIRTINNTSLLGAGNLNVQDPLESGVNIKTINNTSILGSGNITVATGEVAWSDITGKPTFATVATSGSYNDLTDKPNIPVVPTNISAFTNDIGYITGAAISDMATETWVGNQGYITSSALSGYATETWVGQQGYLTSVSWNDVSNKPTFATVATTGSYNDLLDKPTIPVVSYPVTDVEVDGISVLSGTVAQIDLTPYVLSSSLASVALTGDYDDLIDTPDLSDYVTIAGAETITGAKEFDNDITMGNGESILFKYNVGSGDNTVTGLQITTSAGIIAGLAVGDNSINTRLYGDTIYVYGNYLCPAPTGSHSLGNITYPWNIAWIKQLKKTPNSSTTSTYSLLVPDTSSYTADKTIATTDQLFSGDYNDLTNKPSLATVATSGSYNDLTDKPTIPDVSHMVTDNTDQTISGLKNFTDEIKINNIGWIGANAGENAVGIGVLQGYSTASILIQPGSSGGYSKIWNPRLMRSGNNYGLVCPTTGTWTADRTIATTDQIPTVSYPVTDVQVGGTSVLNGTVAEITMPTIPTSLPVETLTTEPTAAYTGPGMKVVYLSAEPTTKYAGYIYMIAES